MTTAEKIIVGAGMLLAMVPMLVLIQWRDQDSRKGIEVSKADCIETCIKVIQNQSVFPPDYHRTVQKCNDVFAEVETCRLVK